MYFFMMNGAAIFLISIALFLRQFFQNSIDRKFILLLWEVLCVRLLLPFPLPFSLAGNKALLQDVSNALQTTQPPTTFLIQETGYPQTIQNQPPLIENPWLLRLWAAGFLCFLTIFLLTYYFQRKKLKTAVLVKPEQLQEIIKHNLPANISAYLSPGISGPFTWGIIHSKVMLPAGMSFKDKRQMQAVLTHELTHIERKDPLWKIISAIVLSLYWMNPFVWILYFFFDRDMEIACDEKTIVKLGQRNKSYYARLLLHMEELKYVPASASYFSRYAIKERIVAIMKPSKKSRPMAICSIFILLAAVIVFNPDPAAGAPTANPATSIIVYDNGGKPDQNQDHFQLYSGFGLTYDADTDILYYNGNRVRYFLDEYPIDGTDNASLSRSHLDATGGTDVYALRDLTQTVYNSDGSIRPGGILLGLREATSEEYTALDIDALLNPPPAAAVTTATSDADAAATGRTLPEIYAEYEPFGVTYNASENTLYYNGIPVRVLVDHLNPDKYADGRYFGGVRSFSSIQGGEIDIYAIRESAGNPDEEGVLTGVAPIATD